MSWARCHEISWKLRGVFLVLTSPLLVTFSLFLLWFLPFLTPGPYAGFGKTVMCLKWTIVASARDHFQSNSISSENHWLLWIQPLLQWVGNPVIHSIFVGTSHCWRCLASLHYLEWNKENHHLANMGIRFVMIVKWPCKYLPKGYWCSITQVPLEHLLLHYMLYKVYLSISLFSLQGLIQSSNYTEE